MEEASDDSADGAGKGLAICSMCKDFPFDPILLIGKVEADKIGLDDISNGSCDGLDVALANLEFNITETKRGACCC